MDVRVAWMNAGYWLRMGDLERTIRWMNVLELPVQDPPPFPLHEGYQNLIAGRIAESRGNIGGSPE